MTRLDTLLAHQPAQARLHRFREMLAHPKGWNLGATDQHSLRWAIEFVEAALEERQTLMAQRIRFFDKIQSMYHELRAVAEENKS